MIQFEPVPSRTRRDVHHSAASACAEASAEAERAEREARAEERQRAIAAARETGYREGWQAAQADVEARLERPMVALTQALQEKMGALERMMDECRPVLAQAIVGHAVHLAEVLTGAPAVLDRRSLQERLIAEITTERGEGIQLVCRGHPDTLEDLKELLQRINCTRRPDSAMVVGGILLSLTDPVTNRHIAEWDASVERQISVLRAQFGDRRERQSG